MYSFLYEDSEKGEAERKKAKGLAKATIEHNLRFEMYKATLFNKTEMMSSLDLIRSHSHNIYCETVRKKTFCDFSMGRNQYWAGRVYDLCVYYMTGTPKC